MRNPAQPSSGPRRNLLRALVAAVLLALIPVQGGCRAAPPWPLWESYATRYLDNQGRVIDHTGQDRTTTEGEAYAMFFALVAGDRSRFDKLLEWTENNLANGDLTARLPAWSWGKAPDGSWHVLDANTAADADLWMAYTLCEAGRLWNDERLAKLGDLMALRVAQQEVVLIPGVGTVLIPGAQGFHPDPNTWYVNPSYLPPSILQYFARRAPGQPWGEVLASLPTLLQSRGNFVMDWVTAGPAGVRPSINPGLLGSSTTGMSATPATPAVSATPAPAPAGPVGAATTSTPAAPAPPPVGSYDAIRVYLWLGMADRKTPGIEADLDAANGMALYLNGNAHLFPPRQVDSGGGIVNPDSPVGFSAAVIPYLHARGMKAEEKVQSDRLVALHDAKSGLYGPDGMYYDQNLALFATGWSEQRFHFESDGRLRLKWK